MSSSYIRSIIPRSLGYARGIKTLGYFIRALEGVLPYKVKELHDKYGPVVRIAPGELSYNCPEAWQDIYGH